MKVDQAVIACGGYGKRLGKITLKTPKPLIKINNLTVIEYIIKNLTRFGFKKIILLCHFKYNLFKKKFHNKVIYGAKVSCLYEKKLLGSSGALYNAKKFLDKNFLFCNGDTFFDINFSDLVYEFSQKKHLALVALKKLKSNRKYDTFQINKKKRLLKSQYQKSCLINTGIYIFSKKIVPYLVKFGSLEKNVFNKLIQKRLISGKEYKNDFLDMGEPQALKELPKFLKKFFFKPTLFLDRDGVINKDTGYVFEIKKFIWRQNIFKFIKRFNDKNYYIIIITNQSGIGRGYYSEKNMNKLHDWMVEKIRSKGGNIDKIYFAPYFSTSKIKRYRKNKNMRKPKIGMIYKARRDFNIDIKNSILVGDSITDKITAEKSGIKCKILQFNSKLI